MPHARPALALTALAVALGAATRPAAACAPAPHEGQIVHVFSEDALIVWDPATHTEHFVRRATLGDTREVQDGPQPVVPAPPPGSADAAGDAAGDGGTGSGAGADFGFLVPSPAQPTLAEAADGVFARLEAETAPRVRDVVERDFYPGAMLCIPFLLTRGAAVEESAGVAPPVVQVLATQRVAGYDAAVLRADDAGALARWLGEHGYAQSPALTAWLEPYVQQHWVVTAFRVARDARNTAVQTSAVRMSFQTDVPVYPYREPADQRAPGAPATRLLRLFLVSPERMDGTIGRGPGSSPWLGEAVYAARGTNLASLLGNAVPEGAAPAAAWVQRFMDRSAPRPGTDDLFFARARSQDPVVPIEQIVQRRRTMIPVDAIALLVVAGALTARRIRRARPSLPPPPA